jgi:hypothetical protein
MVKNMTGKEITKDAGDVYSKSIRDDEEENEAHHHA